MDESKRNQYTIPCTICDSKLHNAQEHTDELMYKEVKYAFDVVTNSCQENPFTRAEGVKTGMKPTKLTAPKELEVIPQSPDKTNSQEKSHMPHGDMDLKLHESGSQDSKASPDTCICGHDKDEHASDKSGTYCIVWTCGCRHFTTEEDIKTITPQRMKEIVNKDSTKAYVDLVHWLYFHHKDVLREFERTKGNLRVEFANNERT